MTEFLHSGVHLEELRALIGHEPSWSWYEHVRLVTCPACGAGYFCEASDAVVEGEAIESEAAARLAQQCPDHAHRFAVGPERG